jgi:cyclase
MLRSRIVVCLDVDHGRVVKGTNFRSLRQVGDPVTLARRYEEEGADEIVFLDISASAEGRGILLETVRRTAEVLFIPLTVGGGVRTVEDMDSVLRAGADKITVNTAAVQDPGLVTRGADRFGSQCVVGSVDAARKGDSWRAYVHGGRTPTRLDAVEWAAEMTRRGAGEILLTSMDRDGVRTGYDLTLTRCVADAVSAPVVASGGAGRAEDIHDALTEGGASAALVAGILHDGVTTVDAIKRSLRASGVCIR